MAQVKFVFSQLVSFLDRNHFNYLVRKYGVLQIVGMSLTDSSPLRDLLDNSNLQNIKDQNDPKGQLFINF